MAIGLVILIVINFFVFVTVLSIEDANFSFVNPKVLYDNICVNWFGAILFSVIFNLTLPSIAICYWIYKLCTVGRKD